MPITLNGTTGIVTPGVEADLVDADKVVTPTSVITGNTTAVAGIHYIMTSSLQLTLPASPTVGDVVRVSNRTGTTTAAVLRNGQNIMGVADNLEIDAEHISFGLLFTGATQGWVIF
jgi:hypothetical protein